MEKLLQDSLLNLQGYYDEVVEFLPKILIAAIVFSILFTIANRGQRFFTARLSQRMDDPLLANFLGRILKIFIVLVAFMISLKILGLGDIAAGLFAGASFSAIVVGFAFKDIGENFLAGIILAFNRPFRVGDTVELNGMTGQVVALNMRTSHLKTFDGKDLYIPNANVVKNPVTNYTIDGFLRHEFKVGLDHSSDVNKAIHLIKEVLNAIDGILTKEKTTNVFVSGLNASTLDLSVQYWLNTFDPKYSGSVIKTKAINDVLTVLYEEGFYLPGNVMELKNYNKENFNMSKKEPRQIA